MTDKYAGATPGPELLPCPFCGEKPHFCPDDSYGDCAIQCDCHAEPSVMADKDTPELAIETWNTRQPDPTLAAENAELRAALDPDSLEAIADEIGGEFKHSARAASLRAIAKWQRAALTRKEQGK